MCVKIELPDQQELSGDPFIPIVRTETIETPLKRFQSGIDIRSR